MGERLRLDGKVALISGGARGQGAAEAALFVAEGAKVVIGDVLADEVAATAAAIDATRPGSITSCRLDVTSEADWAAAVALAEERFGGLDVLVNNAGITNERYGGLAPIESMSLEMWNGLLAVNLTGCFLGTKAVIGLMRSTIERRRADAPGTTGSIVNISSAQGFRPSPFQANYAASKWGVRGLTRVAASELGPLIRVNSVHPGPIDTPMIRESLDRGGEENLRGLLADIPLERVGTADDVANLVLFLASDEAAYCTSSEFLVDGGRVGATGKPR